MIHPKYKNFLKIDGSHPWRDVSPEGYLDYPVRFRRDGRVLYFNFPLAKELGLIPAEHPHTMNRHLEQAVLHTFSIQILNEHDWMNRRTLPKDGFEDRLYMATRYLQLQHENKKGETSGDGRSIWNGIIKLRNGRIFDISSRGTGATALSPGVHEAGEHIPTGDQKYGYASGLAEVDEMLAGAIMSEIFYRQGIPTERCLTVIDYSDKTSIGVRTAPNLIRPAHIFRYLKQGAWQETKDSFEYFLHRQEANGSLELPKTGKHRYLNALDYMTRTYARLSAVMEEEYIFNWLAWDGDNILATGGLLDYGSIRQFAAKHNKYRYEDVDRFSTCLTEQKTEAKRIIQTFVQAVDFIITKEKKNLPYFEEDHHLLLFDQCFEQERRRRMLYRMGFSTLQAEKLLESHLEKVEAFRKVLNYFEDVKTSDGPIEVPDGVDHPPVFLVRHILRELPKFLVNARKRDEWVLMEEEEFCAGMAASYVDHKDLQISESRRHKARAFQQLYMDLIELLGKDVKRTLTGVAQRSSVINYAYRSTGDGLTWIVNEVLAAKRRMERKQIQEAVDRFIESQVLVPGQWRPIRAQELNGASMKARLLRVIQANLELYNENI